MSDDLLAKIDTAVAAEHGQEVARALREARARAAPDDLREKIEALGVEYGFQEVAVAAQQVLLDVRQRASGNVGLPETVSPEDMKAAAQGGRYPSNG